jgi:AraC family transcriptional regulator
MAVQMTGDLIDITQEHRRLVERMTLLMRSAEEPMSVNELAEAAGLSPFYFSRIFREHAGIPPGEFQAALRFERAKELLLTSPASITEICFEVGYGSLGTFSARFKNLVGVSPAEFRQLPHLVADLDIRGLIASREPLEIPGTAVIEGEAILPEPGPRSIYIGVFPDAIASSHPVAGVSLAEPGPFRLTGIPKGTWKLLSAAVPDANDPLVQLLPMRDAVVASGGTVEIRTGAERIRRTLRFHEPRQYMPPVLTALPTLLL